MQIRLIVAAGGLAAAMVAQAAAAPNTVNHMTNAFSAHALTINLGAQNGSKQNGQAWLNDTPAGLHVKVQVHNEPSGASEPAHIHQGRCAKLNPAPWRALTNVVNGVSVTTIPHLTIADLKKAPYAINVHQSLANIKHYVSCGDI